MDKGIKIGFASFAATAAVLLAMPAGADAEPAPSSSVGSATSEIVSGQLLNRTKGDHGEGRT